MLGSSLTGPHFPGPCSHSGDALGQDQLCHAGVCMSAHFERMESVLDTNASTGNTLDLEKVAALQVRGAR